MQPRGQPPGSFYSIAAPGSAMFCPLPGIPDSWDSGKRDSLPSLAAAPVWTRAGPVRLMCLQREEGHRSPQESAWHMENTERFPSHLPPAASLARPTPSMQSPSYPHAVALEDIVPVERWGVQQRVNRRGVLHRAGECRRAGTQTLRDLFMRSKEAQGTGTRQESRQLAATNRSTKKGRT